MSILTEQIKTACSTIASNQQKIYEKGKSEGGGSYDQGFADGKASVKHIVFYILPQYSSDCVVFCTIEGMTWRDVVSEGYHTDICLNDNDEVTFGGLYVDAKPDDIIVSKGVYKTSHRSYNTDTEGMVQVDIHEGMYLLTVPQGTTWEEFIGSEYDETGGLFYIENGMVKNYMYGGAVYYEATVENVKATDIMLDGHYICRF